MNTKLAKKEYDAGVIYMRMDYFRSAERQFDFVLEKYHDTDYAPRALIGKVEALIARKKYQEAKKEIDKFFERYPSSPLVNRARSLKDQIESNLPVRSETKVEGTAPSEKTGTQSEVK